ncbi:lipopolysaccharide biosynthesis protein [Accumulibacter sp.]|uniref:lipopolysaccharide biosynthesis protein n=1 Tax=Accumulibacter sp. TaxID=2053492 RepID=UPI002620F436|nr:lipopolysaccharide biosynthesis protein [Accumulibacter sp.]
MTTIRRSLAYSLGSSYFSLPLQIISTMVVSRLLTPAEIGVFAVAAVFAALASTFRDFGVAEYLIQEKELTAEKIRAALTVNIAVSWSMCSLLFLFAPTAGDFYRDPGVTEVMRVQAFNFLLIPFGAVTMAYFRRQLDFRPVFIAGMWSGLASFTTVLCLAWLGFGYMSLAWSSLAGIVVMVGVSMWFRPADFPRWPGLNGVGRVVHFGKFASGIYIFGQIGKGAPEMIIGRAQDLVGVAMFSRGYGVVELFNRSFLNAVVPVCLPYFAHDSRETGSVNNGYLKSICYLTAIGWPFLAFIGVFAYALIRILYGNQWIDSVPLSQILCLAAAIELIHYLAKEALLAEGDVRRSNALQMGLQGGRIAGLFAVIPFGLTGACVGLLVAAVFGCALCQWHLHSALGLRWRDVLRSCLPSLLITLLSVAPVAVWVVFEPISEANYIRFALVGGLITVSLWLLSLRLFGHVLWAELVGLSKKLRSSLRK